MNQGDLAKAIADEFVLSKADARRLVDFAFAAIGQSLKAGQMVFSRGFGSFRKRTRRGHWVKHPRTGRRIYIPARPDVHFRPSGDLLSSIGVKKTPAAKRRK